MFYGSLRFPRFSFAGAEGDGATLSDLCEAVATLAETEQTARRVLGGAHPLTGDIGICLRQARAAQAATLEQDK